MQKLPFASSQGVLPSHSSLGLSLPSFAEATTEPSWLRQRQDSSHSAARAPLSSQLPSFKPEASLPQWAQKQVLEPALPHSPPVSLQSFWPDAPTPPWLQQRAAADMSTAASTGASEASFSPDASESITSFRGKRVQFLQEQHCHATNAFDKVLDERDTARDRLKRWQEKLARVEARKATLTRQRAAIEDECETAAAEARRLDVQINVLGAQNQSLLKELEQEEQTSKELEVVAEALAQKHESLTQVVNDLEGKKDVYGCEITAAASDFARSEEMLRVAEAECNQLGESHSLFQDHGKADVEALEAKLKAAKERSVDHLKTLQTQEVREHRALEQLQRLKKALSELSLQKQSLAEDRDADTAAHEDSAMGKARAERRIQTLESTVAHLMTRRSLRSVEEHNAELQEALHQEAANMRNFDDKIFSLMDQFGRGKAKLQKQEMLSLEKESKMEELSRQSKTCQDELSIAFDSNLAAQTKARQAAQMRAAIVKKHKMLEEALTRAREAHEQAEDKLMELQERAQALTVNHDYLHKKIDGNEEDKGAMRYELRRCEEQQLEASSLSVQLVQRKGALEDQLRNLEVETTAVKAEIDFIKKEDMLDLHGRIQPILIDSECDLVDRLQINEFLYAAQNQRNPIPPLIEKLSDVLEMLDTAITQADLHLNYLQDSNRMLAALRHKNAILEEKRRLRESWKLTALQRIVANEFEPRPSVEGLPAKHDTGHTLYLDSLEYSAKELEELHKVIQRYDKQRHVKCIRLQDNRLNAADLPALCRLVDLCPYLDVLDLRKNCFTEADMCTIRAFVERVPGVTTATMEVSSGDVVARSGHQIRLVIKLEDQETGSCETARTSKEEARIQGADEMQMKPRLVRHAQPPEEGCEIDVEERETPGHAADAWLACASGTCSSLLSFTAGGGKHAECHSSGTRPNDIDTSWVDNSRFDEKPSMSSSSFAAALRDWHATSPSRFNSACDDLASPASTRDTLSPLSSAVGMSPWATSSRTSGCSSDTSATCRAQRSRWPIPPPPPSVLQLGSLGGRGDAGHMDSIGDVANGSMAPHAAASFMESKPDTSLPRISSAGSSRSSRPSCSRTGTVCGSLFCAFDAQAGAECPLPPLTSQSPSSQPRST